MTPCLMCLFEPCGVAPSVLSRLSTTRPALQSIFLFPSPLRYFSISETQAAVVFMRANTTLAEAAAVQIESQVRSHRSLTAGSKYKEGCGTRAGYQKIEWREGDEFIYDYCDEAARGK